MATTYYYSANGEMYGESTRGVMTTYMTDALGSTIGTFQSGAVVNSYSFSPYGRQTLKAGTGADPRFLWNGRTQYRTTNRSYAEEYVRRRHYSSTTTRWTSGDPVFPKLGNIYGTSPATGFDFSGLKFTTSSKCQNALGPKSPDDTCCPSFNRLGDAQIQGAAQCMNGLGYKVTASFIKSYVGLLQKLCSSGAAGDNVCLLCSAADNISFPTGCDPCKPMSGPGGATNSPGAYTTYPFNPDVPNCNSLKVPEGVVHTWPSPSDPCNPLHDPSKCGCTVVICSPPKSPEGLCWYLIHETQHCAGLGGNPPADPHPHDFPPGDFVNALGCCLCLQISPNGSGCGDCRTVGKG